MRRKITSEEPGPFEDLPDLTDHQRRFVEGILKGMSASDAYRAAYDCSNSKDSTVWCEASKLTRHPTVSQWISAARQAGLGQTKFSLEQHLRRLDRLEELCVISGNLGAAVQAEQLIGKASGHYVEQFRNMDTDPVDLLNQIATISPAAAQELAKQNNIAWPLH